VLGGAGRDAGEHRPGGHLGVDRVALADTVSRGPVGPVDFHDQVATCGQEPRQSGTVGTGALDAEDLHRPQAGRPPLELGVAGGGGRHMKFLEPGTELVEGDRDMNVLVGIDSDRAVPVGCWVLRDAGDGCLLRGSGGDGHRRAGERTGLRRCL